MKRELYNKKKNNIWNQGTKWALVFMLTVLFAPILLVSTSRVAEARGAYKSSYSGATPSHYPSTGATTYDDCYLCHDNTQPQKKYWNPYGTALMNKLRTDWGYGNTSQQNGFEAEAIIEELDSDLDGWMNVEEAYAASHPGDHDVLVSSPVGGCVTIRGKSSFIHQVVFICIMY